MVTCPECGGLVLECGGIVRRSCMRFFSLACGPVLLLLAVGWVAWIINPVGFMFFMFGFFLTPVLAVVALGFIWPVVLSRSEKMMWAHRSSTRLRLSIAISINAIVLGCVGLPLFERVIECCASV